METNDRFPIDLHLDFSCLMQVAAILHPYKFRTAYIPGAAESQRHVISAGC
jgi:hypothetical protein